MTRPIAVLRPEPGNAVTVAGVAAAGARAIALPLFAVRALDWTVPDAAAFDGILFTSANAARHGGLGLAPLRGLPAFAVGAKTAAATRNAGFDVRASGEADAAAILALAGAQGCQRLLHLGGRERSIDIGGPVAAAIAVYANEAVDIDPATLAGLSGAVALLHSARAARQFVGLVDAAGLARGEIAVAAISVAVADAAGLGWSALAIAPQPRDEALIGAAIALID